MWIVQPDFIFIETGMMRFLPWDSWIENVGWVAQISLEPLDIDLIWQPVDVQKNTLVENAAWVARITPWSGLNNLLKYPTCRSELTSLNSWHAQQYGLYVLNGMTGIPESIGHGRSHEVGMQSPRMRRVLNINLETLSLPGKACTELPNPTDFQRTLQC